MPEMFNSWSSVTTGLLLGSGLALLYLGLLWVSVRHATEAKRPGLWMLITGILRVAAVSAVFVLIVTHDWPRFAGCAAGFVLTRWIAVHRMAGKGKPHAS
jgi:F1F0 ATPase subunit 2